MNYLAHALEVLEDPWQVAGTALPDWLRASSPRVRLRPASLALLPPQPSCWKWLALGLRRHWAQDQWFHLHPPFVSLCAVARRELEQQLHLPHAHALSFLAHLLVELLLDAALISQEPQLAQRYYQALDQIEPQEVARFVQHLTDRECPALAGFVERFRRVRFLYDYLDDQLLWFRSSQVLARVGLSLPSAPPGCLGTLRRLVEQGREQLLAPALLSQEPGLDGPARPGSV